MPLKTNLRKYVETEKMPLGPKFCLHSLRLKILLLVKYVYTGSQLCITQAYGFTFSRTFF